jgi:4-diphosphocytidyl-2-C-methyl-D-erythritol kinase
MIAFAPAKINIGLRILNKREDGFHNIDSYFYPIPLYDILEIQGSSHDELIQTGIISSNEMKKNLVFQAIQKIREYYHFPPIKIHLHKQIPVQSGLGGGSSDAISTLKLIDSYFQLNMRSADTMSIALSLGSDCPFFINSKPAKVGGRGEIIAPIDLSLSGKYIMIIKPSFSIDTKLAFQRSYEMNSSALPVINQNDIGLWPSVFTNDFENVKGDQANEIQEIKNILKQGGALYTSLSGSGSAVYGIFNFHPNIIFSSKYFTWIDRLL